jgi:hypothetical protein
MYIDPGAGSMILQMVVAGVVSALALVTRVRQTAKSFVRSLLPGRRAE